MNLFIWCLKSFLYGGKISYFISATFLLYIGCLLAFEKPSLGLKFHAKNVKEKNLQNKNTILQTIQINSKNNSKIGKTKQISIQNNLKSKLKNKSKEQSKDYIKMYIDNGLDQLGNQPSPNPKSNIITTPLQSTNKFPKKSSATVDKKNNWKKYINDITSSISPSLKISHRKKKVIPKEFQYFEVFMSDIRTLLFFVIVFCIGLDKFILVIYLIRGRFPSDLLLFYSIHTLSFIIFFLNMIISEKFIAYTNKFNMIWKYFFYGVVILNSGIFLLLIVGILLALLLFICFPRIQNRIRERIMHYDQLFEEIGQNEGFGNRYLENQPLNEVEMLELESFIKTDSFCDEFCSPKSILKPELTLNYSKSHSKNLNCETEK